jgi:D-tyrosyl-tRNA(Tyr) deacylase
MRALVQRVTRASVTADIDGTTVEVGRIARGIVALVGVTHDDDEAAARALAAKIWNLRIIDDTHGVMNLSVADSGGEVLVVSQFTLYGDTTRGRRPSWIAAARPEWAEPLVEAVVDELRRLGAMVATGKFRTRMQVELVNDGPVTVMLDVPGASC